MDADVEAVLTRWEAAQAELAGLSLTALSAPQVLAVLQRLETGYRRQPTIDHRLIHQLTSTATPAEVGAASWPKVLAG